MRVGGLRFLEEISGWDAPRSFDYTIRESTIPLLHEGSRLSFTQQDQGVEVEWSGNTSIRIPVLGRLLTPLLIRELERSFAAMLNQAKQELESRGGVATT